MQGHLKTILGGVFMRKALAITAGITLAIGLAACGGTSESPEAEAPPAQSQDEQPKVDETLEEFGVEKLVDLPLDEAVKAVEDAGHEAKPIDALEDRSIIVQSNWYVVGVDQKGDVVVLKSQKFTDKETADPDAEPAPEVTDEMVNEYMLGMFGTDNWQEMLLEDPSGWPGYVAGFRVDGMNIYMTLQIGESDEEAEMADQAARAGASLISSAEWIDQFQFFIVENGAGVVQAQKQIDHELWD